MRRRHAISSVVIAALFSSLAAAQVPPAEHVDEQTVEQAFLERVADYARLRAEMERTLPPLPDAAEPEAIEAHKQAMRARMEEARAEAARGDLFTPETEALIRQQMAGAAREEDGAPRAAINEENPGRRRIAINGDYPPAAQLSTVPPQVLLALPRLPDVEVEYRFMGRRLVLLDARARMIVDYMENALP